MPCNQSNTLKHTLCNSPSPLRRGGGEVLERICSKLGGGLERAIVPVDSSVAPIEGPYATRAGELQDMVLRNIDCASLNAEYSVIDSHFSILDYLKTVNNQETDLYFYHSDHLGSSSFITDADGIVSQHLQYLPYGELFVEQRDNTARYYTPYKFSAKEKDEETGYSYFGARYYIPELSIWSAVDPMSDERSWLSPYNYCQNNPVMLTDPDGMLDDEWEVVVGTSGVKLNKLSDKGGDDVQIINFSTINSKGDHIQAAPPTAISATNEQVVAAFTPAGNQSSPAPSQPKATTDAAAPWMSYAMKEIGVKELNPGSNPRIETYLSSAGLPNATDATPWCAAFVHWSLGQSGITGAGATGNSYSNWGTHLSKPQYGAVAIFRTGHVGFYMDTNKDGTLKILHGNWSNRVKISSGIYDPIHKSQIKEYRFPTIK